jgi:hypothetical protein
VTPGSLVAFTLTLSQSELGLTGAPFGSYGLAVEARGQLDGPRTEVGLLRTTLVWAPDTSYVPQQLAWLVPFTGLTGGLVGGSGGASAGSSGGSSGSSSGSAGAQDLTLEQLAAAVAPGSRLRHLLEAAAAPGVGWAVDPALLRTLRDAAGSRTETPPTSTSSPTSSAPSTTPSTTASTTASTTTSSTTMSSTASSGSSGPTTPASAGTPSGSTSESTGGTETPDAAARRQIRSFLADLAAAAPGRTIIELPYADPDVQAVADAGQPQLLHAAEALGAGTVTEVLGVPAATDVAWPADGWADDHALTAVSDDGTTTVVLDARSRPLTDSLGYTPDARAQLPQGLVGWLSDPGLSRLAAAARPGDVLQRQSCSPRPRRSPPNDRVWPAACSSRCLEASTWTPSPSAACSTPSTRHRGCGGWRRRTCADPWTVATRRPSNGDPPGCPPRCGPLSSPCTTSVPRRRCVPTWPPSERS